MEIWYRSCILYRLKSHWPVRRLPWSYAAVCNCPIQHSVQSVILSTRYKPSVASWSAAWLAEVAIAWPNSLFSSTDTQARTPVSYIYLACRFSLTSVTQTLQCRPSWKDWWGCSVTTTCTIYDLLLCLILQQLYKSNALAVLCISQKSLMKTWYTYVSSPTIISCHEYFIHDVCIILNQVRPCGLLFVRCLVTTFSTAHSC